MNERIKNLNSTIERQDEDRRQTLEEFNKIFSENQSTKKELEEQIRSYTVLKNEFETTLKRINELSTLGEEKEKTLIELQAQLQEQNTTIEANEKYYSEQISVLRQAMDEERIQKEQFQKQCMHEIQELTEHHQRLSDENTQLQKLRDDDRQQLEVLTNNNTELQRLNQQQNHRQQLMALRNQQPLNDPTTSNKKRKTR